MTRYEARKQKELGDRLVHWHQRAEKAEARVAELETAVREILASFPADEDAPGDDYAFAVGRIGSIARRVLPSVSDPQEMVDALIAENMPKATTKTVLGRVTSEAQPGAHSPECSCFLCSSRRTRAKKEATKRCPECDGDGVVGRALDRCAACSGTGLATEIHRPNEACTHGKGVPLGPGGTCLFCERDASRTMTQRRERATRTNEAPICFHCGSKPEVAVVVAGGQRVCADVYACKAMRRKRTNEAPTECGEESAGSDETCPLPKGHTGKHAYRCRACDKVGAGVGDGYHTMPLCAQCLKAYRMGYRSGEEAARDDVSRVDKARRTLEIEGDKPRNPCAWRAVGPWRADFRMAQEDASCPETASHSEGKGNGE